MYRSQEILQIFYKKNLSKDIISYILYLERSITFQECIRQMIFNSYLFSKYQKGKIFYIDNKYKFINEIREINGDTNYLKKYCKKLYHIRKESRISALYVNSFRF